MIILIINTYTQRYITNEKKISILLKNTHYRKVHIFSPEDFPRLLWNPKVFDHFRQGPHSGVSRLPIKREFQNLFSLVLHFLTEEHAGFFSPCVIWNVNQFEVLFSLLCDDVEGLQTSSCYFKKAIFENRNLSDIYHK